MPYQDPAKRAEAKRKYAINNPERVRLQKRRSYDKLKNRERSHKHSIKKNYNLTVSEYQVLLDKANGICSICGTSFDSNKHRPHIDHNHMNGKIREIICASCNMGLGHFMDSSELLIKASLYLTRHA